MGARSILVTTPHTESVIILGRTLPGLIAAADLARQGYPVTLLEHPRWTSDWRFPAYLLGCHRRTWALLRSLSPQESAYRDHALPLEFRIPDGRIVSYRSTSLPGSLHWIAGLVRFRGLSWQDRWQLLSYLERVWEQEAAVPTSLEQRTAAAWLTAIGQSQAACDTVWDPLVRFLTGNRLATLSAATFAQAIAQPFLSESSAAQLTLLESSLDDRLMAPLAAALAHNGVTVLPQRDLPHLHFERNAITHVRLCDGATLQATWYLSALPHRHLLALLPDRLLTRYAYFSQIGELRNRHELTVEMRGPRQERAPRLLLLSGTSFERLSVTAAESESSTFRLTLTVDDTTAPQTDEDLCGLARKDLRSIMPAIPDTALSPIAVQRRDQAMLSLTPGTALSRPIQRSPMHNLLVAGGWTDTGWPDHIESAVVSAHRCAEIITGSAG